MGRFAQKHPEELTRLIGEACANGLTANKARQQLAAGVFPNWAGTYEIPLETVRYYARQERKRRQRTTVSNEARQDPKGEVDRLARLLLSAAQRGLELARPDIDTDPKALKEWGEALKTINGLVSDTSQRDKPPKRAKQPVSKDPLSTRLLAAQKTEGEKTPTVDTDAIDPTSTPNHEPNNGGGVPAQAPDQLPQGGTWPVSDAA